MVVGAEVLETISVEVPRTNTDTIDGSRLPHRYIWVVLKSSCIEEKSHSLVCLKRTEAADLQATLLHN